MAQIGDIVEVIANKSRHGFNIGEKGKITGISSQFYTVTNHRDYWFLKRDEFKILNNNTMNTKQLKEQAIKDTINKLCQPNNTFTTLELKNQLIADYPDFRWTQDELTSTNSQSVVAEMLLKTELIVTDDNGTYKTYSLPNYKKPTMTTTQTVATLNTATKTKTRKPDNRISRTKAYDMMKNNKGRFFTAVFIKKDGTERIINCQFLKDQTELNMGYIKVRETSKLKVNPKDSTRQINLQTLKRIKIGGVEYKIRS